jgi:chromosome partitioning protein
MRVIAFMNQKGGVGKTTTAVNLGAALAEMGARVLLMDLDPQAHLTINYGVDSHDRTNLYDVLCGDASFLESIFRLDENLAIAPGSIDLAGAELELSGRHDRTVVLRQKMQAATLDFDYVLIDCPPSLGLLTINSLAVAGEVMIPMQAHFLALQGMAKLIETVQLVNKQLNPRLRVAGVVLTMFDAQTKLSGEVVAELEQFFDSARGQNTPWSDARVCKARIRRNIKLAESPSFGQPVLKYDGTSNGASDYRALAREVATMKATGTAIDSAAPIRIQPKSLVERTLEEIDKPITIPPAAASVPQGPVPQVIAPTGPIAASNPPAGVTLAPGLSSLLKESTAKK